MKIGIIGATGTLGRALVQKLAPIHDLSALVRRADATLDLREVIVSPDGALDRERLVRLIDGSEVIINLAARNPAGQPTDLRSIDDFLFSNALGPALVAAECTRVGKPLLHFSTVAIYEVFAYREGAQLDEDLVAPDLDSETVSYFEAVATIVEEIIDGPLRSADKLSSIFRKQLAELTYPQQASVYGLSKMVGERSVVGRANRSCSVRLSDVFGPGHESRGVVADHLRALQASAGRLAVDLDFRRTAYFIAIDDVLSATEQLAEKLGSADDIPRVLNLVGHCTTEHDLASALRALAESQSIAVADVVFPTSGAAKFDRRYDATRIYQTLPEFKLTPFRHALGATWAAMHS